jgi:hypothetical protein
VPLVEQLRQAAPQRRPPGAGCGHFPSADPRAEGTELSALDHILRDHKTIPPERGIFLPETWRLAPPICVFTSEVFYEGRLYPRAGLDKQSLTGAPPFEGTGLWTVHVAHEGNQNSSIEEAHAVDASLQGCWLRAAGGPTAKASSNR